MKLFKLEGDVTKEWYLNGVQDDVVQICGDQNSKEILEVNIDCDNICFKENRKIDLDNNRCLETCNNGVFKYEYNDICYTSSCPEDTFNIHCDDDECGNNILMCYDKTPPGYYFNTIENEYYECFHSCKDCFGNGNTTINNCKECKDNFTFLNESSIHNTNCFQTCNYYYYLNGTEYKCTENETCPTISNKLIIDKKKCIEDCKKDDNYKYEFNNICYIKCPNGTYLLEDNDNNICFDKAPDGYYLNLENELIQKCYETCNKCDKSGNQLNNNCIECKTNYSFYINLMGLANCYEICEFYYYFD